MDTVSYANLDAMENSPCFINEPEMKVFTRCKDGLTSVVESTGRTIIDVPDSNMLLEITPSMMQRIASLPKVRREKILGVWERLVQGTYDLDERLDIIIDRLLTDISK
jgi:hypothetical protein